MPSTSPLPTVAQLVQVACGATNGPSKAIGKLQAEQDAYGDGRSGSIYNHTAGPMAVLWAREARLVQDTFSDIYFDDARDAALTTLIQGRYPNVPGVARVLSTYGQGTATFVRPNASAGAGTIWQGTRVQVPGSPPGIYQVAADTAVGATVTSLTVPIEATVLGTGHACNVTSGLVLLDVLYDTSFAPTTMTCADGTNFEDAKSYRARVRALLLNLRNGYAGAIVTACMNAGASYVMTFASTYGLANDVFADGDRTIPIASVNGSTITTNGPHGITAASVAGTISGVIYPGGLLPSQGPSINGNWRIGQFGSGSPTQLAIINPPLMSGVSNNSGQLFIGGLADYGLNAVYVADANYQSSTALIHACTTATEGVRVLGCDTWVGGMSQTPLRIVPLITCTDDPGKLPQLEIKRAVANAILSYFGPTDGGYVFKRTGIAGGIVAASPYVKSVSWTSNVYPSIGIFAGGHAIADPLISPSNWPATLSRYTIAGRDVGMQLVAPS